ncbi:unnamed protein product [Linum trigynum]|uniref:TF-B3 domain-containing protein n=1 Tax=Linum trigynum TaxID=586398 RepID=A0AAV2C9V3_9ROSI
MTSSGDQGGIDGNVGLAGTRFFKIILLHTLRDKKLLIPVRFVRNFGEGLSSSSSATLKVPSGLSWAVDLVRDEIGVWFGNGWQDFAEFHSLEYGHFLVFEYKGCSLFSVVIFDKTATEIVYPITRTCSRNQQPKAGEAVELLREPKVEVIEDSPDQGNKGKSVMEVTQLPRSKKSKKKKMVTTRGNDDQIAEGHCSSAQGSVTKYCTFTSSHPFFDYRMTSSKLSRLLMHVPRSFSLSHIAGDEKSVKLQVGDKTWSVALHRYRDDKYVYFRNGWDRFVGF